MNTAEPRRKLREPLVRIRNKNLSSNEHHKLQIEFIDLNSGVAEKPMMPNLTEESQRRRLPSEAAGKTFLEALGTLEKRATPSRKVTDAQPIDTFD